MGEFFLNLSLSTFMKYGFLILGKKCQICKKKCSGEIIRADGDKYFHIGCFACKSIYLVTKL